MTPNASHHPRAVDQVMISSTFTDLKEHRTALITAIHQHKLHANVMEFDAAKLSGDVVESSLQMVRDSKAYIGVISLKYGQIPPCAVRNPENLSITELEFNEAQRLRRPILLFVMGDDHPVKKADIEKDPERETKLNAFRERAKKAAPDSSVNRVYAVFNSLEEFKDKIGPSLADLKEHLASTDSAEGVDDHRDPQNVSAIPKPPFFYPEPDYIGSHSFVGRQTQLDELNAWAKPSDPTNLLLFEAIGGNGKSMLTWEWTTQHATKVRPDWAGRFWYSFYERGAVMADFCQRALAYMTGQPLEDLRKKKTAELREPLVAQLHAKPWLFILDGLERVLVAYHRIDAAELRDEEVNIPTDRIVDRNPCDAIRDEDNDLLRQLAGARPSKILVSSRLTPRVLLNQAGQPINGAKRISLPGLRPADAEKLLRSCGVAGNSTAIQNYLTANCDNHPLVIGILGGLINNYLPDRGNFDAWVNDPEGGAKLDLGRLDLIQRRNDILRAALSALPSASRQLLSTLALLSESVDYETLKAFNPHVPPELEEVLEPNPPERSPNWSRKSEAEKGVLRARYETALAHRREYEKAVQARLQSLEFREAPRKLATTVRDLELRGFLQYEGSTRRHDLHPVVRGVAAGAMESIDRERYGQRVVDHFSSLSHNPYKQAETLEDLRSGLNVVRTLLKLGRYEQAMNAFRGDLEWALLFNLEAYAETLALLRPVFSEGWGQLPQGLITWQAAYLATDAAIALASCGEFNDSLAAYNACLMSDVESQNWTGMNTTLRSFSLRWLEPQNVFAKAHRVAGYALQFAELQQSNEAIFMSRLRLFAEQSLIGKWEDAAANWRSFDQLGRNWSRSVYRPGYAEERFAQLQYFQGKLQESHLAAAESLAFEGRSRSVLRSLLHLRGAWRIDQAEWSQAAIHLAEALRMARAGGMGHPASETGLALAKFHLGQLVEPEHEAQRLSELRNPAHRLLALLWRAIGDNEEAKKHALAAYHWAWADGEPYVHRFELTRSAELLQKLNVPIPILPTYDPVKDKPFPWEPGVQAAIEKLQAEKKAIPPS